VTLAASVQVTLITSGLPAPPLPPGRSPVIFTLHVGAMLSTNVASAEACGSAGWRVPSLLKSTNATSVSAPALAPGSVSTARPVASNVALAPASGFAPVIMLSRERARASLSDRICRKRAR
jgi:hypothetical protein